MVPGIESPGTVRNGKYLIRDGRGTQRDSAGCGACISEANSEPIFAKMAVLGCGLARL